MKVPRKEPSRTTLPSAVVFDLDGTLVNSPLDFPLMRREILRTAEEFGVSSRDAETLVDGGTTAQIMAWVHQEFSRANVSHAQQDRFEYRTKRKLDRLEMSALENVRARKGAVPLLRSLRRANVRMGILTRSSNAYCRRAMDRTSIRSFFEVVRTRSSPGPVKPDPAALLSVLSSLDVAPDRAVFVGDNPDDARCARGANVRFIGLLPEDEGSGGRWVTLFSEIGAVGVARDLEEVSVILWDAVRKRPFGALPKGH